MHAGVRTIDHRWYDYTSGTIDRARYSYGYDYASNRTGKEDPVAATNTVNLDDLSSFDGLHRLTAIDRGDLNGTQTAVSTLAFAQDFTLDQINNWSNVKEDTNGNGTNDPDQDRTHNDANEVATIDSSSTHVAHDAAGNMTKIPQPGSWSSNYTLTWDAWDRLVKVATGTTTVAEYESDARHRRIVKKTYTGGVLNETRHYYLSLNDQVLEERIGTSTTPDRQYTWGTRYLDDLVLRTRDTDANGTLDETLYPLQDANWNITALADTSGAIVERFRYDPYGQSTVLDANFTLDADGVSDYAWEYRFTSRALDPETSLRDFRARYYHDGLGRFIGRDPLRYIDGENLYAGYFVPDGLDPTGEENAAYNHCYPSYLGGSNSQPLIWLDEAQHTAFHDYFRKIFKDVPNTRGYGDGPRGMWKAMDKATQNRHIRNAMRRAGISNSDIKKFLAHPVLAY